MINDASRDGGFGIYVHWPFCQSKCPYCDFNSHVRHHKPDEARFLAAFTRELAHMAELRPSGEVDSVFFGGGTPSLMQPQTVGGILEAIARHWPLKADAEVTLEANPTSVEAERFKGYRAAGVNRVSLGVQALDDASLKGLGRLHTAAEALAAVALARDVFPRVSFDLIYARQGQTPEAWEAELRQALAYGTEHLSLYQLTIEHDTPFFDLHRAGKLVIPDPEAQRTLYELTQALCNEAGLPAYEVSNHARPGAESRHNLVYWRSGDYVGVGPGAHGRLTTASGRIATATERSPETWLTRVESDGHGMIEEEALSDEAIGDEFLLMGLRLAEGIDVARFERVSGRTLSARQIAILLEERMIEKLPSGRLRVAADAFPVIDAVVADLAA
jgi:putative oxygen-independent coproporphyrinogen III oxidase